MVAYFFHDNEVVVVEGDLAKQGHVELHFGGHEWPGGPGHGIVRSDGVNITYWIDPHMLNPTIENSNEAMLLWDHLKVGSMLHQTRTRR